MSITQIDWFFGMTQGMWVQVHLPSLCLVCLCVTPSHSGGLFFRNVEVMNSTNPSKMEWVHLISSFIWKKEGRRRKRRIPFKKGMKWERGVKMNHRIPDDVKWPKCSNYKDVRKKLVLMIKMVWYSEKSFYHFAFFACLLASSFSLQLFVCMLLCLQKTYCISI